MSLVPLDGDRDWASLQHLVDAPHWVYVIRTAAGRCVYVGMTCDLKRRLREHARQRGWKEPVFTVESIAVAGRAAAEREEFEQMKRLLPTQNRYPTSLARAARAT